MGGFWLVLDASYLVCRNKSEIDQIPSAEFLNFRHTVVCPQKIHSSMYKLEISCFDFFTVWRLFTIMRYILGVFLQQQKKSNLKF